MHMYVSHQHHGPEKLAPLNVIPGSIRKVAVLPYRVVQHELQVLLITSSRQRRWILPKGTIEAELTLQGTGQLEAYEEAGLLGDVAQTALGTYLHPRGKRADVHVLVFPMRVNAVLPRWPEAHRRERRWLFWAAAAEAAAFPQLGRLITTFGQLWAQGDLQERIAWSASTESTERALRLAS